MVIAGENEWDHKVLIESFLQANVKSRTKYKCCMLHHCQKENKLTLDPYYIVKSIVYNILRCVPSLANYLRLQQDYDYFKELAEPFRKDKKVLQWHHSDVIVKFFKVLSELKLDFNIGIFITGIENLYTKSEQNKLDNFIILLRQCSLYFPSFLRIVLTMERRPSKSCDKIIELLGTRNLLEVHDQELFELEGKSYLEFALSYGAGKDQETPEAE